MLEGDALIFTLAAEAAILHYVARRFSDGFISVEAHLIFFAVAVWLGARLVVRRAPSRLPDGRCSTSLRSWTCWS